jgi:hypothetical protein
MKYCLKSRQELIYLKKADEIKVDFRDRYSIPDLIDNCPNATIILMCYPGEVINWKECDKWRILSRDKFIMCVSNMDDAIECKNHGLQFYYGYPIKTFYELRSLQELGVCYVRLAEPLFFQMDEVKKFGIPVRAVPNIAYNDIFYHKDGVCGLWIRPEDVDVYEDYVSVFEFEDIYENEKEQALYRIYAEQKQWPGDMNMLFTNFNYPGVNRMILPDVAQRRLNCGQRCQASGACKVCYRAVDLANPDRYSYLQETTDQS